MFKLMIAEDNPYQLDEISEIVDWEDYDILLAGTFLNGKELLRQAAFEQPDIVLTDISMPIMGGVELAEKLRTVCPQTTVIFMSTYSEFAYAKAALELNVVGYIVKPLEREKIKEVLNAALNKLQKARKQRLEKEYRLHELDELRKFAFTIYFQALLREEQSEATLRKNLEYLRIPEKRDGGFLLARFALDGAREQLRQTQTVLTDAMRANESENVEFRLVSLEEGGGLLCCFFRKYGEDVPLLLSRLCIDMEIGLHCKCTIGYSRVSRNFSSMEELKTQAEVTLQSILHDRALSPVAGYMDIRPFRNDAEKESKLLGQQLMTLFGGEDDALLGGMKRSDLRLKDFLQQEEIEHILASDTSGAILCILERLKRRLTQEQTGAGSHEYSRNVEAMRAYIHEHFSEKISVKDVAGAAFLSASYGNACFTKECGTTILGYIVECRMNKAKYLLEKTDERVSHIAEQVGYDEKTGFYLAFKRNVGMSPTDWRAQSEQKL